MDGENLFLAIAIDDYEDPLYKPLVNTKIDILRFTKVLQERYSFKPIVEPILNKEATRAKIVRALHEAASSCSQHDSLIIYYAGHGEQNPHSGKGYWIPVDGTDDPSNYIFNSEVLNLIEAIPAKHILLISDSCFSGTFLTRIRSGISILSIKELDDLPSRWILVSGGEEKVGDGASGEGSIFAISISKYLETNMSPEFPAGELFQVVIKETREITKKQAQADEYLCKSHKGGQLIFRLSSEELQKEAQKQKNQFNIPEYSKIDYYIPRTISLNEPQKDYAWLFEADKSKIYLHNLINGEKRIVLLGGAGSGKSVELYQLALKMKEPNSPYIPVYKRFNIYTNEDLENYLPRGWQEVNPERIVIFLDGLDEVQPSNFPTALRKISGFIDKFDSVRIIISCRTNFYELPYQNFTGTLDNFTVYNLNNISIDEIKQYVSAHFKINGEEFIKAIYDNSFLDLIQKPFFLNILIKHYIEKGKFKKNRAKIIEEALFNQFSSNHQHYKTTLEPGFNKSKTLPILEKIAFIMEMIGKNFVTNQELKALFPSSADYDNLKFLPAFNYDNLQEKWMFEHNNIQEYLASRILQRKDFETIIKIITIPDTKKVKPNWANTISFFVTIADDSIKNQLLDWLLANDPEFIIKFEPDRIPNELRIQIVQKIFNFYSDQGIWISSNKFSDSDLAHIGAFPEVIDFLLIKLNDQTSTRIQQLNSLHILSNFNLDYFPDYRRLLLDAFLGLLDLPNIDHYFIYSVLRTIGTLRIADESTVDKIVIRYRKRTNEYIRAGLYKLIYESQYQDKYIDVFLEGLEVNKIEDQIIDRGNINLLDENIHLSEGLKRIKSAKGIKILLMQYQNPNQRQKMPMSDYKEIFEALIENSIKVFESDATIYDNVISLFKSTGKSYDEDMAKRIVTFFKETGTTWKTFKTIWKDESYNAQGKLYIASLLLNSEILSEILKEYKVKVFEDLDIVTLHDLLIYKSSQINDSEALLTTLEKSAKKISNLNLERPVYKNWNDINLNKAQKSFDLLFNKNALIKEIQSIFLKIGNEKIDREQIYDLRRKPDQKADDYVIDSALELLLNFTHQRNSVSFKTVINWFESKQFDFYQGKEIYQYLQGNRSTLVKTDESQKSFIIQWCQTTAGSINLENLIGQENTLPMILWFYIRTYQIQLPENKLLAFTMYFDFNSQVKLSDPGTIEELEKLLPKEKIHEKVLRNLKSNTANSLAWLNNASYALRQHIKSAEQPIYDYLTKVDEANTEYKLSDLLELWDRQIDDSSLLKELAQNSTSLILKQKSIALLLLNKKEKQFLLGHLNEILNNENELIDTKYYAANQLMLLNDIRGLRFSIEHILSNPPIKRDYHSKISHVNHLTDIEAIPELLKLFHFCKQSKFKEDDFGFFESKLIDAIFNIGTQSQDNFQYVRKALKQFILDYSEEIGGLDFFNINILRMQEQILLKQSKGYSLHEAIKEYDLI